jgi:hypothetical protein
MSAIIRSKVSPSGRKAKTNNYRWVILDDGTLCSYTALHTTLRRRWRKPPCVHCGSTVGVEWALRRDRETYSKSLEAYLPLCRRSHRAYDRGEDLVSILGVAAS